MSCRHLRVVIAGFGGVGRALFRCLVSQRAVLARHGLGVMVVGLSDRGGVVSCADGIDLDAALRAKTADFGSVALLPGGRPGVAGVALLDAALRVDVWFEATSVSIVDGEPALSTTVAALRMGVHVVYTNKAPLALAYQRVAAAALEGRARFRFSSCVGGALPSINVGWRDLRGSRITRVEAILNLTSHNMLRLMEGGATFDDALSDLQRRGLAETDPSLDVDGFDSTFKLVILANAVLEQPTSVADVQRVGIRDITASSLRASLARGARICLLCVAERTVYDLPHFKLTVRPTELPLTHPLARMSGEEMGIVYDTDISGRICTTSTQTDSTPTAAAMIRDLIDLYL